MSGLHRRDAGLRNCPLDDLRYVVNTAFAAYALRRLGEYQRLYRGRDLRDVFRLILLGVRGALHELPQAGYRVRGGWNGALYGDPLGKPRVSRIGATGKRIYFLWPVIANPRVTVAYEFDLAILANQRCVQAPHVARSSCRVDHQQYQQLALQLLQIDVPVGPEFPRYLDEACHIGGTRAYALFYREPRVASHT